MFGNKKIMTSYLHFLQVYIKSKFIYGFDMQKTFRARFMIRNSRLCKEHKRYNEKNKNTKNSLFTKKRWDKKECFVFFWQED